MTALTPNSPFNAVTGLGALKASYAYANRSKWSTLITGLVFLGGAGALVLLAIYLGVDAYINFGPVRVDNAIIWPLVLSLISLVIGVLVVISAWRNWPLAAALYEGGLAFNNRGGLQQVRWNEITSVLQNVSRHYTNGVYTGTTHVYTIVGTAGQKIVLDDRLGKQVEELGREVQTNSIEHLFPRYWQSVQAGQKVAFGPLALDQNKLYAGKKELAWSEVKAVRIKNGVISIQKDKGWLQWASASVPQIPNFFVFYALIGRFAQVE